MILLKKWFGQNGILFGAIFFLNVVAILFASCIFVVASFKSLAIAEKFCADLMIIMLPNAIVAFLMGFITCKMISNKSGAYSIALKLVISLVWAMLSCILLFLFSMTSEISAVLGGVLPVSRLLNLFMRRAGEVTVTLWAATSVVTFLSYFIAEKITRVCGYRLRRRQP